MPPVFYIFHPILKKRNRYGGTYSLNGINERLPPVFYIFHPILEKKEIGTVEAYSLNGMNEILPPVFNICYSILEKESVLWKRTTEQRK